jgi:hypothetical protein
MTAWKSRGTGGEPAVDHRGVQRGQERPLVLMAGPVGVVGERGLLRQGREAGEQGCGRIGEQQVIDVGDAPGAGQLQRQQRQQPRYGGNDAGAGIAAPARQRGQVDADQVGHE